MGCMQVFKILLIALSNAFFTFKIFSYSYKKVYTNILHLKM